MSPAAPGTPKTDADIRQSVVDTYQRLNTSAEGLVSLVRLRRELGDIPRDDLDRILKEMDRARLIQLEPDPNQKALTDDIRQAAIRLGGEPKHFVYVSRSARSSDRRSKAGSGPAEWDAAAMAEKVRETRSVPEGERLLTGLSRAQLQELARRAGITGSASGTKAQLAEYIIYALIQAPGAFQQRAQE